MRTDLSAKNDGLCLTIEVCNIDTLDCLHFIADKMVDYSYSIESNVNYQLTRHNQLYYAVETYIPEKIIDEEELFENFCKDESLCAKAIVFVENIIRYSRNNGIVIWQDYENHLAQAGAAILCLHNARYVPLYTDLLLLSDLDHEVHQAYQIERIIEQHGFTKDTLKILACRATTANGQCGEDQVEGYHSELMETFTQKPELVGVFINTAAAEVTSNNFNAEDDYIQEKLEAFSKYITDAHRRTGWIDTWTNSREYALDLARLRAQGIYDYTLE
ncbi:hypothetical protein MO867_16780 [Microbulbifer sp. OS29]|uniref:Uncharacterized protein n=1 Tax=Microbulbifer okhotskensis TaxID=2926617 RepID=A0A9X2EPG2_9GAMM|nr:hypothetical protein [Microbulbifer okhotskensis]MCO1335987.1 hypothetical protein [Microbulbifer okhotskensis]